MITITLIREEARAALLGAFTDKYPEHTAALADSETIVEVFDQGGQAPQDGHCVATFEE